MNRRAPMVAGVVAGLLAILSVVLLVLPKMGEVGEAQDELQTAQDEELGLESQLRALQDAQAAAPQTQRQISRIEDQVPPTADLPALFRLLQSAADRAAVDFFTFSPGSPVPDPTGVYSTISSQISVTGGYFAIDQFLFLLETFPRAAKVTTISISPTSGGETTSSRPRAAIPLQAQITVEFYTTDASAGPGSIPGPTAGVPTGA